MISSEDQRFPEHLGFDFEAIQRAIRYNEKSNKGIRGASTISQQTAKKLNALARTKLATKRFRSSSDYVA